MKLNIKKEGERVTEKLIKYATNENNKKMNLRDLFLKFLNKDYLDNELDVYMRIPSELTKRNYEIKNYDYFAIVDFTSQQYKEYLYEQRAKLPKNYNELQQESDKLTKLVISLYNQNNKSNHKKSLFEYNVMLYQQILQTKDVYEDNGNIIGIEYDKTESKIISDFEQLSYNEKLDIFSELFIRYDNETYFKNKITMITFDSKRNGFELAREIKKYKI